MGQSLSTARLLLGSFAILIAVGTLVLLLPICVKGDVESLSLADALFFSTSAVCVTGLAPRHVGNEFSFFGQLVILLLIQLGGLGILTFANVTLLFAGKRLGLGQRSLIEETFGNLPNLEPRVLIRRIVVYTFAVEAIGAALLTIRFMWDFPFLTALWLGVFHSVSAFCNAGFSLFRDSLVDYADDVMVNLVITLLVVLGGIGFLVFADVQTYLFPKKRLKRPRRLSYHTRVTLRTTGILLFIGTAMIMALEWPGQATANDWRHFLHAFFLSVSSRTAGFNTVDTAMLTNPTILIVIFLMFVGGSPGSLAGGIRTTTVAVLFALIRSRVRGRPRVELMDRSIPMDIVGKCLATFAGFLILILGATMLIQIFENASLPHLETQNAIVDYGFEVVSATCTVGLSLGVTADLSWPSKVLLVLCMYLGRLGPVLAAGSLIGQRHRGAYSLPEERLMVG
jgi:trk system potassium uptake protein TrkH